MDSRKLQDLLGNMHKGIGYECIIASKVIAKIFPIRLLICRHNWHILFPEDGDELSSQRKLINDRRPRSGYGTNDKRMSI